MRWRFSIIFLLTLFIHLLMYELLFFTQPFQQPLRPATLESKTANPLHQKLRSLRPAQYYIPIKVLAHVQPSKKIPASLKQPPSSAPKPVTVFRSSSTASTPTPTFPMKIGGAAQPYINADGNDFMRYQGTGDKDPNDSELVYLNHGETIKKEFVQGLNHYFNRSYFYNLEASTIAVTFTVNREGKVVATSFVNKSKNPALPQLIKKALATIEPFSTMPKQLQLQQLSLTIDIILQKGVVMGKFAYK